jgi:hypothetical protein
LVIAAVTGFGVFNAPTPALASDNVETLSPVALGPAWNEGGSYAPGAEQLAGFTAAQQLQLAQKNQMLAVVTATAPPDPTQLPPPTSLVPSVPPCPQQLLNVCNVTPPNLNPATVTISPAGFQNMAATNNTPPPSAQVPLGGDPQPTGTYCGPTSTHNALLTYGVSVDINTLAGEEGTNGSGTNRPPIQTVINWHENANAYYWHNLGDPAGNPNGVYDLWNLTKSDIWWGASLIYNVETYGYDPIKKMSRYPLSPYNGYDIRHYFTAYGYNTSGGQIQVYDENNAYNGGRGFYTSYNYEDVWAAIHDNPLVDQILW